MTSTAITVSRRSAFTLAEFVAVLAATSALAALGYSATKTYIVRQQVSEGILLANERIPDVTEFFRLHGEVPTTLGPSAGVPRPSSPFVESVTIVDGRIEVVFGGHADPSIFGRHIALTPFETAHGEIVWLCGNERPGLGLQPLGFAGGGRQATPRATTIEGRHLPGACR